MREVTEIAAKYATEKTNEMMVNAIAKAYADGYRDGYNDKAEEIPVDLRENMTEYVDLGLPSGTLWAKDYEKEEGDIIMYLPYGKASRFNIPTEEQWKELRKICRWDFYKQDGSSQLHKVICVGPNGNTIEFNTTGMKTIKEISQARCVYFWIIEGTEDNDNNKINAAEMHKTSNDNLMFYVRSLFKGYKIPLRLVQTRKTNT